MTDEERQFIAEAARHFHAPNFMMRAADVLGRPIEFLLKHALPARAGELVVVATRTAMEKTLVLALKTLRGSRDAAPKSFIEAAASTIAVKKRHTLLSTLSGAAGGFFGFEALPLELPITTGIMLREIAAIAADFGEDLNTVEGQLECLNVFALASVRAEGHGASAEHSDYFSVRFGLANLVKKAAVAASERGAIGIADALAKGQSGALVKFLSVIAQRFEVTVSEKALAQLVPVISSISGAGINALFAEHLGQTARYHFGLRALERTHGEPDVRAGYQIAALKLQKNLG